MAGDLTITWVWQCVYDDCTIQQGCCIGPQTPGFPTCAGPFTGPDGVSNDCPDFRPGIRGGQAKKIWQGSIVVEGPCPGSQGTSERNRQLEAQVLQQRLSSCAPCCFPGNTRCFGRRYCEEELGGKSHPEWIGLTPLGCHGLNAFTGDRTYVGLFEASCTPGACCYRQPPFVTDGVCTEVADTYRDCTYKGFGYSASPGLTCETQTDNRCKPFCCQDTTPVCTHDYTTSQCLARPGGEVIPAGMDCTSRIPIYVGGQVVTTVGVCDRYACCMPDGSCVSRMRASKCQAAGGLVQKGVFDCLPETCNKGCCSCGVCKDLNTGACLGANGQPLPAKCSQNSSGVPVPTTDPDQLGTACRTEFLGNRGARPPCNRSDLIPQRISVSPTGTPQYKFRWRTRTKGIRNTGEGSNLPTPYRECGYHKGYTRRTLRNGPDAFAPVLCNRWNRFQNAKGYTSPIAGPDRSRLYRQAVARFNNNRFFYRVGYREPCKALP